MEQLRETVMAGKPKIENHGVTNRILENELTFIENRHLEEYFLMAHELVSELKKNRSFLIGPGWDWMLSSHVCRTLGLTNINPDDFINSYQSIDVLIVDDIQEWKHSPKTLDAFCCIFNHMIRNDKQMVLASNCPPVKLQGIDEHLIERFASGVIVEMKKPDAQLCIDILKFKCQNEDLKIPADVIEFVVKTSNGSVCALEGVANSLMATSLALKQKIDIRMAEQIIQSIHS